MNVIVFSDTDAVVNREPVGVADPVAIVTLKTSPSPLVKDSTLSVADAVTSKDAVGVVTADPVSIVILN